MVRLSGLTPGAPVGCSPNPWFKVKVMVLMVLLSKTTLVMVHHLLMATSNVCKECFLF